MTDFLLELRSEEIPARMQAGARAELEKLFRREMDAAGVAVGDLTVWSTPRRLALIAHGLPLATEAVSEEAKGPPVGAPDAAVDGFCAKNGVTRDQLEARDVKGRQTWFAVIEKPGRATRDVLAAAIPAIVRDFSWPKSMRWGAASISTESPRWVRPLSGIVALLGEDLVECEAGGIKSGRETEGHRFHGLRKSDPKSRNFGLPIEIFKDPNPTVLSANGMINIGSADEYEHRLLNAHVIVDNKKREDIIRVEAQLAAKSANLTLVEDEGLVIENAGLTEWPVPLLGRFDEAFLDVPPEVIQLTARVNQKYFVCTNPPPLGEVSARSADGGGPARLAPTDPSANADGPPPPAGEDLQLANAFVCTANIAAADGGEAIVDGNRKVLAARLSDARFFWEQDRKTALAEHAKKLERITFHEKLGTVADKVDRVAKLARWLCEEGIILPGTGRGTTLSLSKGGGGAPSAGQTVPLHHPADGPPPRAGEERAHLANLAEQAARLCKADLVTEMVGEFPELQGLMGGYYARAEGLPDEVADAIRDHYKPVGQGDDVPTAPVTVAVSLADKLDTLVGFYFINERPTGSKDPFALRRAVLGVILTLSKTVLRLPLIPVLMEAGAPFIAERLTRIDRDFRDRVLDCYKTNAPDFEKIERLNAWRDEIHDQEGFATLALGAYQSYLSDLISFFADRLKVQQREAGIRHDLIDAVFALGGEDDLVRLLARVHALQAFMGSEDGANLLAGYKRAANILKKAPLPTGEGPGVGGATPEASNTHPQPLPSREGAIQRTGDEDPLENVDDPQMRAVYAAAIAERANNLLSYTPEPAEKALIDALDAAEPQAAAAVEAEDFAGAMAALASLRGPIDRFFEEVTVNADEEIKRSSRFALLARFRAAVHKVADFSRIEG